MSWLRKIKLYLIIYGFYNKYYIKDIYNILKKIQYGTFKTPSGEEYKGIKLTCTFNTKKEKNYKTPVRDFKLTRLSESNKKFLDKYFNR